MIEPIDLSKVQTKSIRERANKVRIDLFGEVTEPEGRFTQFVDALPDILKARDFKELCQRLNTARKAKRAIILAMGDALIKVGLTPYILRLMDEGFITALAMQGAGIIHDTEIALIGETSEDVQVTITDGSFGMAEETGSFIHSAIKEGVKNGIGLGEAVGRKMDEAAPPHREHSLTWQAWKRGIPLTVHVAYGTDIIHMHPEADGAVIGKATEIDFRKFAALVCQLEGGAIINAASAVILPEVFLKSLSLARNLGHKVSDFTAANMDMLQHYRPMENVVKRPTTTGGRGFALTGNLEILFPLLTLCLLDIKKRDG
ncbi:MAG: hypothetical protein B1H03_03790 [Planctomycetales bacterium 4484_113]|nr:MAG: hypothetical protein B1H03_03790 [Planctomycetales bacterium 4484_113]